jgi:biopolymer transport protein ExbB
MQQLIDEALTLWIAGGPLMIPLAILGGVIYFSIFELLLYLYRHNYYRTDQNEWGHWVDQPDDASGEIGRMIRFSQEGANSVIKIRNRFAELRTAFLPRLGRRIQFCKILIGAAPLTGLLGTVMGMLATFFGLSTSTGGETIDLVAGGIREALITTQTGLVLAIPAYVLMSMVKKQATEMDLFFTRMEILTILKFEHTQKRFQKAS